MEKRKLKPKDLLRDLRSGVDDATLMTRYALSAQALQSVFSKLVNVGMLTQAELDDRVPMADRTVDIGLYICPACGNIQAKEFTECPRCGYMLPDYLKKAREAETKEEPTKAPVKTKSQVIKLRDEKKAALAKSAKASSVVPVQPEEPLSDLLRVAGYCRVLGIATVVCYVLFVGALFALTQLVLPPGLLSLGASLLAVSVLGIPLIASALLVLVTLKALGESIKSFARVANTGGD
jgi:hypothetical protein